MGSLVNEEDCQTNGFHSSSDPETELSKFKVLKSTDQIKELQTIIRDKETSRSDFKFVADRLIRMVSSEFGQGPVLSLLATVAGDRGGAESAPLPGL